MSARTREQDIDELRGLAREILDSIDRWDEDDFLQDRTKQRALERLMELLGEVATRLGDEVPDADIHWRDLRRLRIKLAHAYEDVEARRLWQYADQDVRRLLDVL